MIVGNTQTLLSALEGMEYGARNIMSLSRMSWYKRVTTTAGEGGVLQDRIEKIESVRPLQSTYEDINSR